MQQVWSRIRNAFLTKFQVKRPHFEDRCFKLRMLRQKCEIEPLLKTPEPWPGSGVRRLGVNAGSNPWKLCDLGWVATLPELWLLIYHVGRSEPASESWAEIATQRQAGEVAHTHSLFPSRSYCHHFVQITLFSAGKQLCLPSSQQERAPAAYPAEDLLRTTWGSSPRPLPSAGGFQHCDPVPSQTTGDNAALTSCPPLIPKEWGGLH